MSPLKNVFMFAAYPETFLGRGHQIWTYIFKRSFSLRIVLKYIENEKDSRRVRVHAPLKKF